MTKWCGKDRFSFYISYTYKHLNIVTLLETLLVHYFFVVPHVVRTQHLAGPPSSAVIYYFYLFFGFL